MSKALRSVGVLILCLGTLLLIVEINALASAKRFTLSEALGHIIEHAARILLYAALMVGGAAIIRKTVRDHDTDDIEERPKRHFAASRYRGKDNVKTTVFLALCIYAMYVCFHVLISASHGCNTRSILMTLFPVRQIYLLPMIEREMSVGTVESVTESDGLASILGAALAEQFQEPILDVVRYGSCVDLYRMTGRSDELTSRQGQTNPTPVKSEKVLFLLTGKSTVAYLNIRSGPGKDYDKIRQLAKDEEAVVFGRNSDGTWVEFDEGWVAVRYLNVTGDVMELPVTSN